MKTTLCLKEPYSTLTSTVHVNVLSCVITCVLYVIRFLCGMLFTLKAKQFCTNGCVECVRAITSCNHHSWCYLTLSSHWPLSARHPLINPANELCSELQVLLPRSTQSDKWSSWLSPIAYLQCTSKCITKRFHIIDTNVHNTNDHYVVCGIHRYFSLILGKCRFHAFRWSTTLRGILHIWQRYNALPKNYAHNS